MAEDKRPYRRQRYEYHRWQRRQRIDLSGTQAQQIAQAVAILSPYIISVQQVGSNWKVECRDKQGRQRTIVNTNRLECLKDLAQILDYKFT